MADDPSRAHLPTTEFIESVRSPELVDLGSSVTDVVLDAFIEGGALDGIPIVQWFVGMHRGARAVREQLFLRKVFHFLSPLAEISQAEREEFVRDLYEAGDVDRAGEAYLLWLERVNDMQKAPMLGRIFRAYVRREITFEESCRFADILDHSYLPYLRQIRLDAIGTRYFAPDSEPAHAHYLSIGLLYLKAEHSRAAGPTITYEAAPFAPKFLRFVFDGKSPDMNTARPL